jgi:hypothetical protein
MMKSALHCLVHLSLAALLSGCLASLQPARTLPDGSYRLFAGIEYLTSSALSSSGTTTTTTTSSTSNLTLDTGFRLGTSRNSDFGIRLSLPGLDLTMPSLLIDLKYRLFESSGFVGSFSFGLDYLTLEVSAVRNHALSAVGSLNFGYDFGEYVGSYLSIRNLTPIVILAGGTTTFVSTSVLGASLGMRFGDTIGLLAEGTYLRSLSANSDTFLVGGAFFIGGGSGFGAGSETNRRAENWKARQAEKGPRERVAIPTGMTRGVSKVLKVRAADNMALLSHPDIGNWKVGDKVCLMRDAQSMACGSVTKSDATGAVLKYSSPIGEITPGTEAMSQFVEREKPAPPPPATTPEPKAPAGDGLGDLDLDASEPTEELP